MFTDGDSGIGPANWGSSSSAPATRYRPLQRRQNLLELVRAGRGLVGIHCAAHVDWPEYIDMIGGYSIDQTPFCEVCRLVGGSSRTKPQGSATVRNTIGVCAVQLP